MEVLRFYTSGRKSITVTLLCWDPDRGRFYHADGALGAPAAA